MGRDFGSVFRTWRPILVLTAPLLGVHCAEKPTLVESDEIRDPVEVRAMVDRAVATTGDLLTYSIEVKADPAFEVEIPETGAEIAGFRIVDVGREEPVEKAGRVLHQKWYQLRADLVGSYVLPPVTVRFRPISAPEAEPEPWQTQVTSEIFVEVESVLPAAGQATDIRGLKPLRQVRPGPPWVRIGVIVTVLALLVLAAVWYLRRRAGRRSFIPQKPAHELAFEALDGLRRTDFDDPGAVRRFYFQISEVLRAYVEGRYRLNATDLTTEEILAGLVTVEELAQDQNEVLRRFLVATDQVKFAHREPSRSDIEGTYEQALGFVEATRPVDQADKEGLAA